MSETIWRFPPHSYALQIEHIVRRAFGFKFGDDNNFCGLHTAASAESDPYLCAAIGLAVKYKSFNQEQMNNVDGFLLKYSLDSKLAIKEIGEIKIKEFIEDLEVVFR